MANDSPHTDSPDGRIRIEYEVESMRMSHEVYIPKVIHRPTRRVLLDLQSTTADGADVGLWDGQFVEFHDDGRFTLKLREYTPAGSGFSLTMDAAKNTYRITQGTADDRVLARICKSMSEEKRGR